MRQGLNELLAPFFELGLGSNGAIFNAFYALISKFLPNTLRGHDLKTLRRALALLRVARGRVAQHLRPVHKGCVATYSLGLPRGVRGNSAL